MLTQLKKKKAGTVEIWKEADLPATIEPTEHGITVRPKGHYNIRNETPPTHKPTGKPKCAQP